MIIIHNREIIQYNSNEKHARTMRQYLCELKCQHLRNSIEKDNCNCEKWTDVTRFSTQRQTKKSSDARSWCGSRCKSSAIQYRHCNLQQRHSYSHTLTISTAIFQLNLACPLILCLQTEERSFYGLDTLSATQPTVLKHDMISLTMAATKWSSITSIHVTFACLQSPIKI